MKKECSSCQLDFRIMNKSVVEEIAIPDQVWADHWRGQTNLVLVLGEKKKVVTVDIRWIDQVVVAKKNIKQGNLIGPEDLRVVDKDVTFLKTAYINDPSMAQAMISRRLYQRGQVIDEGMLKKPLAIRYGEPVKLELQEGSLQLVINGQAKGAGAVGDSIPIFIPRTRKRVMAKILSEGRVKLK
ncbi:MAG: flagellar basal body P-ring formation chaperone FlgA [Pseudomonadota bacterium]